MACRWQQAPPTRLHLPLLPADAAGEPPMVRGNLVERCARVTDAMPLAGAPPIGCLWRLLDHDAVDDVRSRAMPCVVGGELIVFASGPRELQADLPQVPLAVAAAWVVGDVVDITVFQHDDAQGGRIFDPAQLCLPQLCRCPCAHAVVADCVHHRHFAHHFGAELRAGGGLVVRDAEVGLRVVFPCVVGWPVGVDYQERYACAIGVVPDDAETSSGVECLDSALVNLQNYPLRTCVPTDGWVTKRPLLTVSYAPVSCKILQKQLTLVNSLCYSEAKVH